MAAVAGYGGKVMVGASAVAQVRNWSADIQREEIDATHMNDGVGGWRSYISGLGSGTGSMDVNWDMSDTNGQLVLQNAVLTPPETAPVVKLYTNSLNYYTGSIIVTSVNVSVGTDGLAEATVNFRFTGAVTYA
jgi:predicted secreted protein